MTLKLDGKQAAAKLESDLLKRIKSAKRPPSLHVVLIGDNPASKAYVSMKQAKAKELGIDSKLHRHPDSYTENDLLALLEKLNQDPLVDGILVQLPLPPQIAPSKVINAINPDKDVDGFHPINLGKLLTGDKTGFVPCTPLGVCELLRQNQIDLTGKHVVILGRSLIVGRPLSILLSAKEYGWNATVTVAHSQTENLMGLTAKADCLICAAGIPETIGPDWIKEGAVVIDVGTSRVDDPSKEKGYRIAGDVRFKETFDKAGALSPVPGGVGPMTIALLMNNTLKAYEANALQTTP